MNTPLATYGLMIALAGVTGWAVSEALEDDGQLPAVSPTSTAQAAPGPLSLTLVTPDGTAPAQGRRGHAVARRQPAGATATSAPLGSPAAAQAAPLTWSPAGSRAPALAASPLAPGAGFATPAAGPAGHTAPPRHTGHHGPAATAPAATPATSTAAGGPSATATSSTPGGTQVLASSGAIVYIGDNGQLYANTGATSTSGVVALGVDGSTLGSGSSHDESVVAAAPATGTTTYVMTNPHANGSFLALTSQGGAGGQATSLSGFEDHSVSVLGNNQIVTYDDSNVVIGRDGLVNANTGDTDSSGLNAVDVTDSTVRSGNSGDGEGESDTDDEDEEQVDETAPEDQDTDTPDIAAGTAPAGQGGASTGSSDDEDGSGNDEAAEDGVPPAGSLPGSTYGTVTDEGASIASGDSSFVVGADGYDDVSIRSTGDGNIVTYDDSNVVIGGQGQANLQIGDSDTGGAVVMGIRGSDVSAGCEGDLCYSD